MKINFLIGAFFFFTLTLGSCDGDSLLGGDSIPKANFTIEQITCDTPPCVVSFINQSKDATTYIWDFGDGSPNSQEEDPTHTYDSIATYEIKLTALNNNGEDMMTKSLFLGEDNTVVVNTESPFWLYGAGRLSPESFRNHHYEMEVTENNATVDITLASEDVDVQVWFFDPLGEQVSKAGGQRTHTLSETLNTGKYKIVAGTYARGGIGNYTLEVQGKASTPVRINSQNIMVDDQAWDSQGGGYNYPSSLRNHQYTFEVTEDNTAVDIILESSVSEVTLELWSPIESLDKERGNKSEHIVYTLNEGTYTIIAGTNGRDRPFSEYVLDVEGQITNLSKKESSHFIFEDIEWSTNGGGRNHPESFRNHHYMVDVSESNHDIDIIVTSPHSNLSVWLYGPNGGTHLRKELGQQKEFIVEEVSSGLNRIVVGTYDRNVYDATYTLDIVGKINGVNLTNSQDTCVSGTWLNGSGWNNPDSPDNGVFTFDVTEINSTVDIVLESPDADVCLWLFDPLGQQMDREDGGRSEYILEAVTQGAGTYRIVAGTEDAGAAGTYKVSLVGQFENFKKEQ